MNQKTKNGRRVNVLVACPVIVCKPAMYRSATLAWRVTKTDDDFNQPTETKKLTPFFSLVTLKRSSDTFESAGD